MSETSDVESLPDERKKILLLLLISFAVFNLGYIIDQTIRWTNHLEGFLNGVFHIVFMGLAWCIWCLPMTLVILAVYRWRRWRRFRTHWVLAPPSLAFAITVIGLLTHPPTARVRLKTFANTTLPDNARALQSFRSGGGVADYYDVYYFQTTPHEITRMIQEMGLDEDQHFKSERRWSPFMRLPNSPDYREWTNPTQYTGGHDGWSYYLITDESRTQVYISFSCI